MKTVREIFLEKGKSRQHSVAFDIIRDGENLFSTNADNGADQVDKKLSQLKFKKIIKDLKIIRTYDGNTEDVTKLFIK